MNANTNKAVESKREEFRRYLEKSGVLDAFTKVLVGLYESPDKPNNALDFVKKHVGAGGPDTSDIETLRVEVTELRAQNEQLRDEVEVLRSKLSKYETDEGQQPTA